LLITTKKKPTKVLNHQIVDKLVNETHIEIPRDFLKKWLLTANEGKLTAGADRREHRKLRTRTEVVDDPQ
jgi:hypothetical protein